jgi:VWFA-related protein
MEERFMKSNPRSWCFRSVVGFAALLVIALPLAAQQGTGSTQKAPAPNSPEFTLTTSVNRVLLDVVVTDPRGNPVHGLTRDDFALEEDGKPQNVINFDAYNFDKGMDYTPPDVPPLQPNTFVNLPATPERGPLYVLLYDLVNIPSDDQIFARRQLVKFIDSKPAGARFAIFVSSDGLHLVQGFTSDQRELFAAVDPKGTRPHVPEIFLMGVNFGEGDKLATAAKLNAIARYLAPMPGRKNLIWIASQFPLSLFPSKDDTGAYREEIRKTLDLLASNQIAVYPVDVSGVVMAEEYEAPGGLGDNGIATDDREKGVQISNPNAITTEGHAAKIAAGPGASKTVASYMAQDEIARITGGKAIYSSNDVRHSLAEVTENGGNYYTLTYSSTNKNYDGSLRHIQLRMKDKGCRLSYRRAYYGPAAQQSEAAPVDTLSASMKHGAPEDHRLIFGVHVAPTGAPSRGTREQMASLEKAQNDGASAGRLKPIPLQVYTIDYTVMARQLQIAGSNSPELEIAAAAYDSDGRLLNSTVDKAMEGSPSPTAERNAYRIEQQLDVPLAAKYLRFAVRDDRTDKIGAMEILLPLAPEK